MSEHVNRRVLVVDDKEEIHRDYRKILCAARESPELADAEAVLFGEAPAGPPAAEYELDCASQGEEGVALVRRAAAEGRPYAVAFVDMRMPPGMDGVETIEKIWAIDPEVQVVICTAYSDYSSADLVARLGHTDRLLFLRKPFDNAEVFLLASALTAKWNLARQARLRLGELEALAAERTTELRQEVAERRAAEERLRHLALHDALTGLPNRACLLDRLGRCLERRRRDPGYRFAVLFLDLDNFKLINDSLGHDRGDELLVAIAERLRGAVRALDTVHAANEETTARLGGDEFIVLLDGLRRANDAVTVAERIQEHLGPPFRLGGHEVCVTASIGITVVERPYDRAEDVLRDADTAMYRAKSSGKGRHATFDERLHADALDRLRLENDLRRAVEEGQFRLVYEPIVATDSARLMGFEALLRWDHPGRGVIGPSEFIHVAEETGLILPIGRWVLAEACRQMAAWTREVPGAAGLSISVNLSRRQIIEPGLVRLVSDVLEDAGLEPGRLNLEITESAAIERLDAAVEVLRQLKELGVQLHMDDFGTGLSSLSCLHLFPIDVLKIDRSFIMNMNDKPQFAALVNAVLTLAQNLRIKVIAEGVEGAEQLAQLLALGCDYIQGYHISRSLRPGDAAALIRNGVTWPRLAA